MVGRMLVLLLGTLSFCCYTHSATAADVPTPTTWPIQFHALLVQNFSGELGMLEFWYDWGKGRNLHVVTDQLESPYWNMEWTNGTSFFWYPEEKTCRTVDMGVGILRPTWLHGANYLGVKDISGFTCHVFEKADFITYYEDVETQGPVYWEFYTGRQVHIITFEPGVALDEETWQAPDYCFSDKKTDFSDKD